MSKFIHSVVCRLKYPLLLLFGEKTIWELLKDAVNYFEQIQEAVAYKTTSCTAT